MLTTEVKDYIQKSVLCWLATANAQNQPNVSPKEVFTYLGDSHLLIANIASPISVQNIQENPQVAVSFVDVFVQKGFKLTGIAHIISPQHPDFQAKSQDLRAMFGEGFPILSVIEIEVKSIAKVQAPSYSLVKGTTEESQIVASHKTYGVKPI
jgi:uncharacterized protein